MNFVMRIKDRLVRPLSKFLITLNFFNIFFTIYIFFDYFLIFSISGLKNEYFQRGNNSSAGLNNSQEADKESNGSVSFYTFIFKG